MAPGGSPARLGCALLLVLVMLCSPLLAQKGGPGAVHEISVSHRAAGFIAAFIVDSYNLDRGTQYYHKLLRILKAELQLWFGVKFFLKVELVKTNCKKKGNYWLKLSDLDKGVYVLDLDHCTVPPKSKQEKLLCESQVLYFPWDGTNALLHRNCQPSRS